MGAFNATAGCRFNRWLQDMRRRYGKDLQYAKAAELQGGSRRSDGKGRMAIHFHVLIRLDRPDLALKDFRRGDPSCPMRELAEKHGFGHEVDVQAVDPRSSYYCAKYVSKTADDRASMPWVDRATGMVAVGNGRYRAWTASRRWGLTMKQLRVLQAEWVRSIGAGGPGGGPAGPAPGQAAEGGPLDLRTESYTSSTSTGGM